MKAKNGAGNVMARGYVRTMINYETRLDHIRIAERAIGKRLPKKAIVHHVDMNPTNNTPSNLVICQSAAYHKLLHLRIAAVTAGCNPDWRKCRFCKEYDAPENLFIRYSGVHHRECINTYYRNRRGNP